MTYLGRGYIIQQLYVGIGDDKDRPTDQYYAGDEPAGGTAVRARWAEVAEALRYPTREAALEVARRLGGVYARAAGYDAEVVEAPAPTLADRLRTLADWCEQHGVAGPEITVARVRAYDGVAELLVFDPGTFDRLTADASIVTSLPEPGVSHERATVDGVEVSICRTVPVEEPLPPEPGEPAAEVTR